MVQAVVAQVGTKRAESSKIMVWVVQIQMDAEEGWRMKKIGGGGGMEVGKGEEE